MASVSLTGHLSNINGASEWKKLSPSSTSLCKLKSTVNDMRLGRQKVGPHHRNFRVYALFGGKKDNDEKSDDAPSKENITSHQRRQPVAGKHEPTVEEDNQRYKTIAENKTELGSDQTLANIREWIQNSSGIFTCKSAFEALSVHPGLHELCWAKKLWKTEIPQKIKVFFWTLALEKLNVQEIMQKSVLIKHYPLLAVFSVKGLRKPSIIYFYSINGRAESGLE